MGIEETGTAWKTCFTSWPEKMGRRGILVTVLNDEIPFSNFWTSDGMLLLERSIPDTSGARKVLVPYSQVSIIKLTEVIKPQALKSLGFSDD